MYNKEKAILVVITFKNADDFKILVVHKIIVFDNLMKYQVLKYFIVFLIFVDLQN